MDQEMQNGGNSSSEVNLIAKYGKERIELNGLDENTTTIGMVKEMLQEQTRILAKRQKLVGLVAITGGTKGVVDDLPLSQLKAKGKTKGQHQFILMGTPEEQIVTDIPTNDDVVDDFDFEFNAGSQEWLSHVANGENLKKFTEKTEVHIMHPPRDGKPLLVLDLDHTLLDFSARSLQNNNSTATTAAQAMKRPHMDTFLTQCYEHYDLVVWSQTSWRWLETKLIELGMLAHAGYRFCFVLDKTSMFTVTSKQKGMQRVHHVKPLQIIWSKFEGRWDASNTVHLDDLKRNFALNPSCGLRCTGFYRKKSGARRDSELLGLGKYLVKLAEAKVDFQKANFDSWESVIRGNSALVDEDVEDGKPKGQE